MHGAWIEGASQQQSGLTRAFANAPPSAPGTIRRL
jgi:hypothetical protein